MPAHGPRAHLAGHLPREWPMFAPMRPGNVYLATHLPIRRLLLRDLKRCAVIGGVS